MYLGHDVSRCCVFDIPLYFLKESFCLDVWSLSRPLFEAPDFPGSLQNQQQRPPLFSRSDNIRRWSRSVLLLQPRFRSLSLKPLFVHRSPLLAAVTFSAFLWKSTLAARAFVPLCCHPRPPKSRGGGGRNCLPRSSITCCRWRKIVAT